MAGNKKPSRSPNKPRKPVSKEVPVARFVYAPLDIAKRQVEVIQALNRLIDSTGSVADWDLLIYHVYVGALSVKDYFILDDDIQRVFFMAPEALAIVKMRMMFKGIVGVRVCEMDSILAALELTNQALRNMKASEIHYVHKTVRDYFDLLDKQLNELDAKE